MLTILSLLLIEFRLSPLKVFWVDLFFQVPLISSFFLWKYLSKTPGLMVQFFPYFSVGISDFGIWNLGLNFSMSTTISWTKGACFGMKFFFIILFWFNISHYFLPRNICLLIINIFHWILLFLYKLYSFTRISRS